MKRNILIIGGMGPQASLLLHERIIQRAISEGAKDNEDFPVITHLSISIRDFIATNATGKRRALETLLSYLYCLWRPELHAHCYSL
jgi:aspartate racemase